MTDAGGSAIAGDQPRVVVAIAPDDPADRLLRTARDLAAPTGDLVVVAAANGGGSDPDSDSDSEAADGIGRAATEIEGVPVAEVVRVDGEVAGAVAAVATDHGADAVLLSRSTAPTDHSDVVLGTTPENLAAEAGCDVFVERVADADLDPDEPILLPTSGGSNSDVAADVAEAMARVHEVGIELVRVIPPNASLDRREEAERELEGTAERIDDVPYERRLLAGEHVAEAIADHAADYAVIVIGGTEVGIVDRLVGPEIPETVQKRTPNRVITVYRRGEDDDLPFL